ncbi:MAG: hypothetical protein Fur0037_01090 [Planctomycetota bacterium]
MVKAIGIDAGDSAVKAVLLDGSYRKVRLLKARVERALDPAEDRAEAIQRALKDGGLGTSNARLGHPCREAVLRTIEVPFRGRDAIRKIVKSEVESAIHSHSVDDMVVDFHEVAAGDAGSKILVAAIPKEPLRKRLKELEKRGIEPEVVDLDTMALYRVAHWCGAFDRGAAAPQAAAEAEMPVTAEGMPSPRRSVTAVLDIGARSTRVILVDGGALIEMRALRLGDQSIGDDLAAALGLDAVAAQQAALACLASGGDQMARPAASFAGEEEGEPAALPAVAVPHEDVERAAEEFLRRLARELTRFLVSVGGISTVDAVFMTGGGSRLPGMGEMLAEVFGSEPCELDVLGRLQHDLSEEDAAELSPSLAVAVGLALGPMGGPAGFNLRQEDLVFTRGFERVKFPLAILCMVALFTCVIWGLKLNNDLKNLEYRIGRTYSAAEGRNKDPSFFGMLSTFPGGWFNDTTRFPKDRYRSLVAELLAAPVERRLEIVKNRLGQIVEKEQNESGIYEDLSLESGLAVLVRFAEMLEMHKGELGRFLVTKISLSLAANANQRYLDFTVVFRGDDFRGRTGIGALRAAIKDECARADSPFLAFDENSFRENVFADKDETGVEGAYYDIRIDVKPQFEPFGGQ